MLILAALLHAGSSPHFAPHPFTVVNRTHQNIEGVWEGAHTRGGGDQVNYLGTDGREGQPGIPALAPPVLQLETAQQVRSHATPAAQAEHNICRASEVTLEEG